VVVVIGCARTYHVSNMLERLRIVPCLSSVLALAACAPTPPESTGGTGVATGPFGRGVFTLNVNDYYDSTNISLVGLDGGVLSESFVTVGLSGDMVAPSMPSTGGDVVLIDRARSILTWMDVRTAEIRAQFHVDDDELGRNPWDYLPIAPDKAYVTRYDRWPGNSVHGDIILVDPSTATVTSHVDKRIDVAGALGLPSKYVVHPARGVVIGGRAYLTTVIATIDYDEYAASHVVVIDTETDEVVQTRELTGLHDCAGIAASPSGEDLAIVCSGDLYANVPNKQEYSGVVILSTADLSEKKRVPASALASGPLSFFTSFASERSLLVSAFGDGNGDADDTAVLLNLETDATREIHRAAPVQLGQVLCPQRIDGQTGPDAAPPACFVTDAEKGVLLRFPVENGDLGDGRAIVVDEVVGLPPRYLGQF
jgi:hypothetical protein